MYAFISYANQDKKIAHNLKICLQKLGVDSFMAHEDIDVSEKWAETILKEIGKADIFVSLWSKNYTKSKWCIQESGIAAYREEMTEIPLSIDKITMPLGASNKRQAKKVDPENISDRDILPGLMLHDVDFGMELICNSKSYRDSEVYFTFVEKYICKVDHENMIKYLDRMARNKQVVQSWGCAEFFRPLFDKYKDRLDDNAKCAFQQALGN